MSRDNNIYGQMFLFVTKQNNNLSCTVNVYDTNSFPQSTCRSSLSEVLL